jgi:hypothetical protein
MTEAYLPVSSSVYDAVSDLHKRLQEAYGDDVTVSDTIDFLGHQFFVHQRLLDIGRIALSRMSVEKRVPGWLNETLNDVGLHVPQDATCFIRANIDVPVRWASTRWLIDVEGINVMKCLSEPEGGPEEMDEKEDKKNARKIKIQ